MFSDKGFADGKGAARSFGSAAAAIEVIVIAVIIAAAKRAGNSVELQTFVTDKPQKEDLIKETAREPIDSGWRHFPLWIKVPLTYLPHAISSRRCFPHRLRSKIAVSKYTQPE
jgi:hypothetical protein